MVTKGDYWLQNKFAVIVFAIIYQNLKAVVPLKTPVDVVRHQK